MGGITTIINKVKYIGIASLTIAILSILTLNIISSYSSSNTLSNAEQVNSGSSSNNEPSTLANNNNLSTCNPSNTNAESCISLAITSSSSTSTGGNNANLSLQIPREGGIATGRHTVSVSSNNVAGYYVMLTGNAGSPAMTPTTSTSQAFIQSTTGTLANPTYLDKGQWGSWGIALPNSSLYTGFNTNEMDYSSTDQDVLHKTTWAAVPGKESDDSDKTIIKTTASSKKADSYPVYYGVRVDSPVSVPADTYAAQVVYTATTNEVPAPTMTSINPNQYELGSGVSNIVTIMGSNLRSAYYIYLQGPSDAAQKFNCTNISVASSGNSLTCTLPTDLQVGVYDLHLTTQGGTTLLSNAFTYAESLPEGMNRVSDDYDGDGRVAVDYDENMIPVAYDETTKTWRVVTNTELQQNPKNWYNYTKKQWANALTVSKSSLQSFRDKQTGVDSNTAIQTNNNPDILGYWVYIPRYAYEVMRPNAIDKFVTEQNFDIVFETAKDMKKIPATTCSTNSDHRDYRNDCAHDRTYPGNDNAKANGRTTWATHPAFTWTYTSDVNGLDRTVETNGFWIGKFETTGTQTNPTIKPNQLANIEDDGIGMFYSRAKSVGVSDEYNIGEANFRWSSIKKPQENSHNLASTTSHMLKNDEWGAVAYLSASKFGAGAGNVRRNAATNGYSRDNYDADGDETSYNFAGITGCGPAQQTPQTPPYISTYDDGSTLNKTTIESPTACSQDTSRAYDGSLGVLASTTGNIYGVYDMAGSRAEYVVAAITEATDQSDSIPHNEYSDGFSTMPTEPYVNIFKYSDGFVAGYASSGNMNYCRWETCGGQALIEVAAVQSVWSYSGSDYGEPDMWGQSSTDMPFDWNGIVWTSRGGTTMDIGESGIFAVESGGGDTNYAGGMALRVALQPPVGDAI